MLTLTRKVVNETYEDVPAPVDLPVARRGKYVHAFRDAKTVHIPGSVHGLGTPDLLFQAYTADQPRQALFTAFSVDEHTHDVVVRFAQVQSGRVVLLG